MIYNENAALYARFGQVLAEVETIVKNAEADAGKYVIRYADINTILATLKPACAKHGIALSQPIGQDEHGNMRMDTMLIDTASGDVLLFPGPIFAAKGDPQAVGSAITYYRRYALASLFALQVADDDGGQAHRSAVAPEGRTPAEIETRAIIAGLSRDDRKEFIGDFKEHFGCGLTDMPESRHGEALGYAKWWTSGTDARSETYEHEETY